MGKVHGAFAPIFKRKYVVYKIVFNFNIKVEIV